MFYVAKIQTSWGGAFDGRKNHKKIEFFYFLEIGTYDFPQTCRTERWLGEGLLRENSEKS